MAKIMQFVCIAVLAAYLLGVVIGVIASVWRFLADKRELQAVQHTSAYGPGAPLDAEIVAREAFVQMTNYANVPESGGFACSDFSVIDL